MQLEPARRRIVASDPPSGVPWVADVRVPVLLPAPIRPEWILEGDPRAAAVELSRGSDGLTTGLWECTAGRFEWHFASDEIIHVLEGEVEIEDCHGVSRRLVAGSVAHFLPGTSTVWTVPVLVRKFWVDRALPTDPLSRGARTARRTARALLRRA